LKKAVDRFDRFRLALFKKHNERRGFIGSSRQLIGCTRYDFRSETQRNR